MKYIRFAYQFLTSDEVAFTVMGTMFGMAVMEYWPENQIFIMFVCTLVIAVYGINMFLEARK